MTAWMGKFASLKEFRIREGHCNVPFGYKKDPSLGSWVNSQRNLYKKGKLNPERVQMLRDIGFIFELNRDWNLTIPLLEKFKKEYGHCNVPLKYPKDKALGIWVRNQRALYRRGELSQERIDRLHDTGFSFDLRQRRAWDQSFSDLIKFKKQYGHCNVQQKHSDYPNLGYWVHNQRNSYKNGKILPAHFKLLKKIGFPFELQQRRTWDQSFSDLVRFKEQYGHCNVQSKHSDYPNLGHWVYQQRKSFRNGTLSSKHIKKLEEIGFSFDFQQRRTWDQSFSDLIKFKERYGHCKIPEKYSDSPTLYYWVNNQRTSYRKGKIRPSHFKLLKDIGFSFECDSHKKMQGKSQQAKMH